MSQWHREHPEEARLTERERELNQSTINPTSKWIIRSYLSSIGKLGGSRRSEAKTAACRANAVRSVEARKARRETEQALAKQQRLENYVYCKSVQPSVPKWPF